MNDVAACLIGYVLGSIPCAATVAVASVDRSSTTIKSVTSPSCASAARHAGRRRSSSRAGTTTLMAVAGRRASQRDSWMPPPPAAEPRAGHKGGEAVACSSARCI
jgi:hypothetical protein